MTAPADRPPREPDRGDPVRSMTAWVLFIVAVVCVFAACVAYSLHHGWVPPACFAGAAAVLAVAAVVVLAGKGRRQ